MSTTVAIVAFNKSIAVEVGEKALHAWEPRKYPLSPQQQAVADWALTGSGHGLVIAKPGSGKTSLLIGLLPFIADNPQDVNTATMHSVGFAAWRQANKGRKIQVESRKVRNIVDTLAVEENDPRYTASWAFLCKLVSIAKANGFGMHNFPSIEDKAAWEELIDNYSLDTDLDNGTNSEELVSKSIRVYRESLKQCRDVVDFDDMILAPLYNQVRIPTYDWVLVDEAQDLSHVRQQLVIKMLASNSRMVAVGDPLQAIYSFTGSNPQSMDLLEEELPGEVTRLPLSVTFRVPRTGVELAKQYAPDFEACEWAEEGKISTAYLSPKDGQSPDFWSLGPFTPDDAILCRVNRPLVELAYAFLKRRIPAYIEGREIGAGLIRLAQKWKIKGLDVLVKRLEDYRDSETTRLMQKKMEAKAEEVNDKIDTLMVLIDATRSQGGSSVFDLVSLIQNMFGDTEDGRRPRAIVLSSVHKFKGREADRVFILGRSRYMPSRYSQRRGAKDWEIEGEKCVIFVALTRHKKELVDIIVPDDEGGRKWKR